MKLPVPFIQLPLLFDARALAAEIAAFDESFWIAHPTGFAGNSALPLVAVKGDPALANSLEGPMRPTPALLRCPCLIQILGSLRAVIGRVRLMRLSGRAEVSKHADTDYYWNERVRVHVPIVMQPGVRFSCGDARVTTMTPRTSTSSSTQLAAPISGNSLKPAARMSHRSPNGGRKTSLRMAR